MSVIQLPPIETNITDPGTLELIARELVEDAMRRAMPEAFEPEPEVVAEPMPEPEKPAKPKYILQQTRRVRFKNWVTNQLVQPKRIVRWLNYWWMLPWRGASFVATVASPKLEPHEVLERDTVCNQCEHRYIYVRLNGKHSDHCGKCGCPPWKLSTLEYKNGKSVWKCPMQKHAGQYKTDRQKETLVQLGYKVDAVLAVSGGGCTGCGCGKARQSGGN